MRLTDSEFRGTSTCVGCLFQRRLGFPMFRWLGLSGQDQDIPEIGCGSGYGAVLLPQLQVASPSLQTAISVLTFKERIMKSLNGTPAPSLCLRGTAAIVLVLCGLILASGCRKSDSGTHPSSVE